MKQSQKPFLVLSIFMQQINVSKTDCWVILLVTG